MYVTNAFSLNMLKSLTAKIIAVEINVQAVKTLAELGMIQSAIGHKDTASVVSNLLGSEFVPNRISLNLDEGEVVIVAQYSGPRLPEGSTELPEGAEIKWVAVSISSNPIRNISGMLRKRVTFVGDQEDQARAYLALNWHKNC